MRPALYRLIGVFMVSGALSLPAAAADRPTSQDVQDVVAWEHSFIQFLSEKCKTGDGEQCQAMQVYEAALDNLQHTRLACDGSDTKACDKLADLVPRFQSVRAQVCAQIPQLDNCPSQPQ